MVDIPSNQNRVHDVQRPLTYVGHTRGEHCWDEKVHHPFPLYSQLPGIDFVDVYCFKISLVFNRLIKTLIMNVNKTTVQMKAMIKTF